MENNNSNNIMQTLSNSKSRREFFQRNRLNVILYFVGIVSVFVVYHFLSDGDFSFLLSLGSMTRMFGFALLLIRIFSEKNCSGLSLKTMQLYAVVFLFRLISVMRHEGYLPYDSSGDWFFLFEFVSLTLTCGIMYAIIFKFRASYNPDEDAFGKNMKIPSQYGAIYLLLPCLVLSFIIHPTLNQNFVSDTAWTFALYLETVAVIPQLYMFQKQNRPVEPWTSHFVFALGLSRFFLFTFWLSSYHELNDRNPETLTGGWVGMFVLLNQLIHLAVMGDFCYYYLKSAKQGGPLILPGLQV